MGKLVIAAILIPSFMWLAIEFRQQWTGIAIGLSYGLLWGALIDQYLRERQAAKPRKNQDDGYGSFDVR
jgi:hypothetical protein